MKNIINASCLNELLSNNRQSGGQEISAILKKAVEAQGLSVEETALLINTPDPAIEAELFRISAEIKEKIYGKRIVFFTPLYLSNFCNNHCQYCGFQAGNISPRKKLTLAELRSQTEHYLKMGHKRILLESGEDEKNNPIDYILEAMETIYSVSEKKNRIRRINVNIAATTVENHKLLKQAGIGTYQLFQETYHTPTYAKFHRGPKADYQRQLFGLNQAFEGGIDDVGMGVLFGLYDWRFELLSLITHAAYLKKTFGVGPHTVSIPRIRPAPGVDSGQFMPVSDHDFLRIIALLRLALPYTGIIITTREKPEIRRRAFEIGVSQASAASITTPGVHSSGNEKAISQFEISDKRSLEEIIASIMQDGFVPSFCTACYRQERTGEKFMAALDQGKIHEYCLSNSILTLQEYLLDFATEENKKMGNDLIERELRGIGNNSLKEQTLKKMGRIRGGERDLYF